MKYYKWIEQTKDTVESVIYRCEFQIKFPGYYNVEPYTAARCNKTQNWFISHPIKCLSFREPLINIRAIMKCRPLPLLIHLLSSHHLVHVTTIQPVAYCPPFQETNSGTLLSCSWETRTCKTDQYKCPPSAVLRLNYYRQYSHRFLYVPYLSSNSG